MTASPSLFHWSFRHRLAVLLAGVLLMPWSGCAEAEEIRSYEVAKSPAGNAVEQVDRAPPRADAAQAGGPPLQQVDWTVPEGWRQQPDQRAMRVATFEAGDEADLVEVVVSVFPGDTGGLLANVNRWRQQVGLGALSEAELGEAVQPFGNPGLDGHTMHLRGRELHVLGAIIHEPSYDRTWFVKAVAEPEEAERLEAEVFAFARSFGIAATTTGPPGAPAAGPVEEQY